MKNVADRLLESPFDSQGRFSPIRVGKAISLGNGQKSQVSKSGLTLSQKARSRLIAVLTPEIVKLLGSNDIQSNLYSKEYAGKLAAKLIDTGVDYFEH